MAGHLPKKKPPKFVVILGALKTKKLFTYIAGSGGVLVLLSRSIKG